MSRATSCGGLTRLASAEQGAATGLFHHEKTAAAVLSELVDRNDMGMIQPGQYFRFGPKAVPAAACGGVAQDHLDRHHTVEIGVVGLEHAAHPAFAELTEHAEPTDLGRDCIVHKCVWQFAPQIPLNVYQRTKLGCHRVGDIGKQPEEGVHTSRISRVPAREHPLQPGRLVAGIRSIGDGHPSFLVTDHNFPPEPSLSESVFLASAQRSLISATEQPSSSAASCWLNPS